MPYTAISDVFVPEVFASYQIEDPVEKTNFVTSGVAVTNPLFNALANGAGRITTMPFWKPLDASVEPNYSNDVYTDIAEPQKVTAEEMIARIADLNEGFNSADLVAALAGSDPLKFVASHIDAYWQKQFQRRVIATVHGIYNDNVAADGGDMVINISNPDVATVTDAMRFSAEAVVNAALTLGDSLDVLSAMAVHSIIYGRMIKLDLIDFVEDSNGKLTIPTYMGKRVVVDDGLPVLAGTGTNPKTQYITVLFGAGAVGYGNGTAKVPSEFDRAPDRANGGGTETLWSRKRWVIHPFGFSFSSTTITGPGLTPTWADLRLAANWSRVVDRKNVNIAFLVTNA